MSCQRVTESFWKRTPLLDRFVTYKKSSSNPRNPVLVLNSFSLQLLLISFFELSWIMSSEVTLARAHILSSNHSFIHISSPSGSGSSGEQFAPPTPRQYGSVGEAASICETAQDPTGGLSSKSRRCFVLTLFG